MFYIVVTAIVTQALCSYSEAFLGFFEVASQLFAACFREIVVTGFLLVDCVPKHCTLAIVYHGKFVTFGCGQIL